MHCISTTDLMGPDWDFLAPYGAGTGLGWSTFSGQPRTVLERRIRRPHLGRYRAAWQAVQAARNRPDDALLVSHLPLMAAATNVLRRRRCPQVPQIGFSFNFTDLPAGARLRYLRGALQGLTECVVYSRFECDLYPGLFDLDPATFRFLPWAMEPPVPGPDNPAGQAGPYLCAIGGEGRDYALLAQVMRALPQIRMVVVARPHSVAGVAFPDNVQVFTNLPLAQTWRIAQDSGGLVIPLVSPRTACGHITLVGAQLLGIPLVITESQGVRDYVTDGANARLVGAGAARDLQDAIMILHEDPAQAAAWAAAGRIKAQAENSPQQWVRYFQDRKAALGL